MNYRGPGVPVVMPLTPMVKRLIIATVAVWIGGQFILDRMLDFFSFNSVFALVPGKIIFDYYLWQPLTYMFLHSADWSHIVFNMLMLWWLGAELEQVWGSKYFLFYYLMAGIGAGLFYCAGMGFYALLYNGTPLGLLTPVLGASGAIYGLLLAYGKLFGERVVAFMMVFPMPAKYFVMLLGTIQLLTLMGSSPAGGEVAYLAHLTGLLSGYLLLKVKEWRQRRPAPKKRGRNLRLVVDNNNPESSENQKGPKYWN
jgi:membrane associated rhomboid family serine protease